MNIETIESVSPGLILQNENSDSVNSCVNSTESMNEIRSFEASDVSASLT